MANKHIVSFIQGLSSPEIKIVTEHLQTVQPLFNKEKNEVKELLLFNFLIANRNKKIEDSEILKEIRTTDLNHLKRNLFAKVTEALTSDKHINNKNIFGESDIAILNLRKQLLIFNTHFRSLNQNKTKAIYELLDEIIKKAIEFEAYDLLLEALNAKKYFLGITSGIDEFNKINAEINFYEYCKKALYYATDSYYRLIIDTHFIKSLSKKELDRHIKISIDQMESDLKKTKSQQINYYLQILKYALSEQQKDYKKAIIQCNDLITLLKKSKVIYRRTRIAGALSDISLFKVYTSDYIGAAIDAKKARDYHIENGFDFKAVVRQEFYSYFYAKDYNKSLILCTELFNHFNEDINEFRKSKYIYFKANILFATKHYKEALALLNNPLEIEKDRSRWNIHLRILIIMTFIELNKTDEAATSLESLRKYMERILKTEEVNPRAILIIKLLREFEKDSFMIDPKNAAINKMLKSLSQKNKAVSWEHYSPELIPFHEWLEGKLKV